LKLQDRTLPNNRSNVHFLKKRCVRKWRPSVLVVFFLLLILSSTSLSSNWWWLWARLNHSFNWIIFLCFIERKHIFKECWIHLFHYNIMMNVPWFYYSIRMNVPNTWLVHKKSICTTIINISDKNTIYSFSCYSDYLLSIWTFKTQNYLR
jgi:hypothetical protein